MASVALPLASIILRRGPQGYREGRVLSPRQGLEVTRWVPRDPHCGSSPCEAMGDGRFSPIATLQAGAASRLPAAAFLGSIGKA